MIAVLIDHAPWLAAGRMQHAEAILSDDEETNMGVQSEQIDTGLGLADGGGELVIRLVHGEPAVVLFEKGTQDVSGRLLCELIARTPEVVAQVQAELPQGFSQQTADQVLGGLLDAAKALEGMPAG